MGGCGPSGRRARPRRALRRSALFSAGTGARRRCGPPGVAPGARPRLCARPNAARLRLRARLGRRRQCEGRHGAPAQEQRTRHAGISLDRESRRGGRLLTALPSPSACCACHPLAGCLRTLARVRTRRVIRVWRRVLVHAMCGCACNVLALVPGIAPAVPSVRGTGQEDTEHRGRWATQIHLSQTAWTFAAQARTKSRCWSRPQGATCYHLDTHMGVCLALT